MVRLGIAPEVVRALIGARSKNEIDDAFIGRLTFLALAVAAEAGGNRFVFPTRTSDNDDDKTAMFRFLFQGKYYAAFFRRIALGDILTTTTLVHVGEIKAQ